MEKRAGVTSQVMDLEGPGGGNEVRMIPGWPLEYRVLVLQASLVGVAALGAGVLDGGVASAIAGGVCILAPNAWMARRARGRAAPGQEMESAAGLFLAMLAKLGFTIALMAIVLSRGTAIDGPAFFAGLISALIGHHASFLLRDDAGQDAQDDGDAASAQVDRE